MAVGQLPYDAVLGKIGVLVLVYQHIAELVAIFLAHLGMLVKQQVRIQQQVIKIHGISLSAPLPVAAVYGMHLGHLCRIVRLAYLRTVSVCRRQHQPVLGVRDVALHGRWLVVLLVESHLFDDAFQQALRVSGIIDGKVV